MFGHSHIPLQKLPCTDMLASQPISSFFNVFQTCVATTGVGIFIAISGWFGIKFSTRGLVNFIFTVLFTLWSVYFLAIVAGVSDFNLRGVGCCMGFYEGYWFVIGYLGLYLASPVLNTFINQASKRDMQIVLIGYYLFQSYCSWLSGWYDYYYGYSIILFSGIYLTSAYIRKYPIQFVQKHVLTCLMSVIMFVTLISMLSLIFWGHAARQIRDDNPLVIASSVLLVIYFSRFSFSNSLINWLSASCFAVYLIHYNPLLYQPFVGIIRPLYANMNGIGYSVMLLIALSVVYVACTLFDQIRIALWSLLNKYAILCRERTDGSGGDDSEVIKKHHV